MTKVTFARATDEFSSVLRQKVDEYFRTNGINQTGNWKLYSKTIILFLTAITMYITLVFFTPSAWLAIPLCMLMGVNVAAIGFNVMHDGCHGSYSKKAWVNDLMGYSLDLLGGCSFFWKTKHNIAHHSYTNIDGHDEDIDIRPFLRLSDHQKKYWFHKYQHIYWPIFYSLTYFWWVAYRDFKKYMDGRVATTEIQGMDFKQHVVFWLGKVVYIAVFWVLPISVLGWKDFAIGYGVMLATTGLVLALVFQLAHTVQGLDFPEPDPKTNKIENAWFVHQLHTTANFATKSKFWGWLTGGLNFQVEHHLFPRVSHIHYPAISKVVKKVCADYNIAYHEQPSFMAAVISHLSHLKAVGAMA